MYLLYVTSRVTVTLRSLILYMDIYFKKKFNRARNNVISITPMDTVSFESVSLMRYLIYILSDYSISIYITLLRLLRLLRMPLHDCVISKVM